MHLHITGNPIVSYTVMLSTEYYEDMFYVSYMA